MTPEPSEPVTGRCVLRRRLAAPLALLAVALLGLFTAGLVQDAAQAAAPALRPVSSGHLVTHATGSTRLDLAAGAATDLGQPQPALGSGPACLPADRWSAARVGCHGPVADLLVAAAPGRMTGCADGRAPPACLLAVPLSLR